MEHRHQVRVSRARRSRRPPAAASGGGFRSAVALLVLAALVAAGAGLYQAGTFLRAVSGFSNPIAEAHRAIDPPPGSVAWKLAHGQRVNLLLLGYGGSENDAPWLTDSMVVLALDPAGARAMEVSIPRDLQAPIDAFAGRAPVPMKINAAFAVGMDDASWTGKKPQFTGTRDRGGHLAEQTVGAMTGLVFDGYEAVDFRAFRDVVNALGGLTVCLDGPLDDNQYPNYHDGLLAGGIHFKAGCQRVDGEQALELARSRHAIQPLEASDFGRSRRQQLLINAIRHQAVSAGGLAKAPQLMAALQQDFVTDLGPADLAALYRWGARLPDSAWGRSAVTDQDLVSAQCSTAAAYLLCPQDPTLGVMHQYFADLLVSPQVVRERAPVELVNGSRSLDELGDRVGVSLRPLGIDVGATVRTAPVERTVIYDYSGGRYPATVAWLERYFGATVAEATPGQPSLAPNPSAGGLAVVLGHDYALRWIGRA